MTVRKRVGILISGRGSNMKALIDASADPDYPAQVAIVISNRPKAPGLTLAADAGIPTRVIDHTLYSTREDFDAALQDELDQSEIQIICCAGFMRILTDAFVEHWRDRQLNIHPSLLPSFKGLHCHERAIDAGARISGCTVHFVRPQMDSGPIIAQAAVPVLADDDAERLAARILTAEHKLYPLALRLVASGSVRVVSERVLFSQTIGVEDDTQTLISPVLTRN